ncbi:MAG: succinate dehydrogenase/fumarate reductase iron-sulfur subunit [Lutibacter sp.]|uniref:succinate dehydrogenase/fumarate reductase iron-sulfur subunit n=1 Tax=Lutibacter sp. TaxID=1925666 RepID=UPI0019F6E08F|nr:succinate dehydrogenase/fumarate reductase iron-sulfur subunit [Lutibacter sp.]NOR28601.1 succinate dehydrogenase/fumarate reductase iron-sulfur subunit [Lutibacter sp.]
MKLTLKIWRQENAQTKGKLVTYKLSDLSSDTSFLEMLDVLNEQLAAKGEPTVEFDHDCREGICGQCSLVINGKAHGPEEHYTTCQTHLRSFNDGDTITIEPFRANSFPVIRDLKVDRSSMDRIIQAGGYISSFTGMAPEANSIPIHHDIAESAFDSAACIGCGACIATCKNSSAALFVSAKIGHLAKLPQGQVERNDRALWMVNAHDDEGFGSCSNTGACAVVCPQEVQLLDITRMNFEYNRAKCLSK